MIDILLCGLMGGAVALYVVSGYKIERILAQLRAVEQLRAELASCRAELDRAYKAGG